ncbi:MAG: hypothetical protein V3R60_05010 [Acidobacteriota bacterium]
MNIRKFRFTFLTLTMLTVSAVVLLSSMAMGADPAASLKPGKAGLKSAGALAFGPEGILFVGDSAGAAVFALDTEDRTVSSAGPVEIKSINVKVAAYLGTSADQILINDLAVNPISMKIYLSASRGRGPDAAPVILQIDPAGRIKELSLDGIRHSKVNLPNAPDADAKDRRGRSLRVQAITDLAYVAGKDIVAGLSNEEFASNLRSIRFPFSEADAGTSVEIYHGNHGQWETRAPVRSFVPFEIKTEPHLLAAYTCTPLVTFPLADLKPGTKVVGTTIAELGNRNRPLDMIVYKNGGSDYILMNNSSRGVMKLSADKLETFEGITERVGGVKGVPYETIAELKGVKQLDNWDDGYAIILVENENGSMDLKTIALP